jgi:hypothetical protein
MRRTVLVLGFLLVTTASLGAQTTDQPSPPARRFWPNAEELRRAAGKALRDPRTWLPAAGAALIAVGGWDSEISQWATTHQPIFGSAGNAARASDYLRTASQVGMLTTAAFAGGEDRTLGSVLAREAVESGGAITATFLSSIIKGAASRERPDGSNHRSFPSGHTSSAFAQTAFAVMNLRATPMSSPLRTTLVAGSEVLAIGTGWARVEAGAHYPTDVLVGAALGNFVATLTNNLCLDRGGAVVPKVVVAPSGVRVGVALRF